MPVLLMTVCHEGAQECSMHSVQPCCTEDEGRPLEAGLQEQASNRLKLHWLRAIVVSVEEKVPHDGIRLGYRGR